MNSDFKDLLKRFNEYKVRYLVVGGYAVMKYTEPRYTKDMDIWVDASPRNARAVFRALQEFGAPLVNLTEVDFATEGTFYQMGRPPARIDILMSVTGLRFGAAWRRRVSVDFDGVLAHVISREDLIVNKRASGRPQDMIDVDHLEESVRTSNRLTSNSTAPESEPTVRPRKRRRPSQ
jgi:hypothetical protein